MTEYKISFCTVCMNRLSHLQQTLPANLADNQDYPHLEFILLDYNSSDGLEDWVKENLQEHLDSGRLVYYKTKTPVHFKRAHSKNLVHKLASGEVVCNLDADNYTGKGFAAYINHEFVNHDNIFLTAIGPSGATEKGDVLGRICIRNKDFHNIGGYDERMTSYGFDDYDLANRLEQSNVNRKLMASNPTFFEAITHTHNERINNDAISIKLKKVLARYISPSSTDFLLLFNDGTFKRATLIDTETHEFVMPLSELTQTELKYKISVEAPWLAGEWQACELELKLFVEQQLVQVIHYDEEKQHFVSQKNDQLSNFYQIQNQLFIESLVMFYSQFTNRIIMAQNQLERRTAVNSSGFGVDIVYKNFNYQTPISV